VSATTVLVAFDRDNEGGEVAVADDLSELVGPKNSIPAKNGSLTSRPVVRTDANLGPTLLPPELTSHNLS
jgi:hypothetical protein